MTATETMTKARAGLVLDAAFWASLALNKPWKVDNTEPTGWTDGTQYAYNEEWIETLTLAKTKGFIAHEVSHNMFNHNLRRGERDMDIWNEACDYVINPILLDAGFELPDGYLFNAQFKGKEAEEVYNLIYKKRPGGPKAPGQGQGNDPGRCGGVKDFPSPTGKVKPTSSEIAQQTQAQAIETQQALTVARQAGTLPAGLERLIEEYLEPVIPWREVTARFIDQNARNDYTWTRPNKRYIATGIYLPSLENPELGRLLWANDSSGSITQVQFNTMFSELRGIVRSYDKVNLTVIFCDSVINPEPVTVEHEQDIELLMPRGGGGTDFKPPFEWAEKEGINPKAMIYFTDGYCHSFPSPPSYPTLWILTNKNDSFNPPFGEIIVMKD